jgi:hypothetical protein
VVWLPQFFVGRMAVFHTFSGVTSMSLFVAFERVGSGNVKPSTVFNRTFHTSPHVKSAVAMRKGVGGRYELADEKAELLTFKPKKAKPGATTYFFVDVEHTASQRLAVLQKAKAPKPAAKPKSAAKTKPAKAVAPVAVEASNGESK